MANKAEPDKQSEIKEFTIQAAKDEGRVVDIRGGLSSFSYYETILSNIVTSQFQVLDSGNTIEKDGQRVSIIEGLPIRGGEKISWNILDPNKNPLKMELYLNKLMNLDQSSTTDMFDISCASKEFFSNEMTRVVKRYDGKISESVTKILKEVLKADIAPNGIEETSNSYNFIGNDKKPLYIATWLGTKSIPTEAYGETAGFFLYQNQDGMHFKSVDGLLKQEPKKRYIHTSSVTQGESDVGYDGKILSYDLNRTVDLQHNLMMGVYNNRTLYFNPYSFVYTHKDFNITEQGAVKHAGTDDKKDWDFIAPEFTQSTTRLMTNILDIGTIPTGKDAKAQLQAWVDDKDGANDKVMERMVQSVMRYNQLFSVTTSITIGGDFSLKAGDMIACDFPRVSGKPEIDKKSSGNYLIANLCHYMTPTHTYTQLGLIRDSYGRKL